MLKIKVEQIKLSRRVFIVKQIVISKAYFLFKRFFYFYELRTELWGKVGISGQPGLKSGIIITLFNHYASSSITEEVNQAIRTGELKKTEENES